MICQKWGGANAPPRPSALTALKHVLEWTKRGIILCVSHDGKALKRSVQTCLQASREHTLTLELVNKPSRSLKFSGSLVEIVTYFLYKKTKFELELVYESENWDSIMYIVKLSLQEKSLCIILKIQQKVVKI